MEYSSKTIFDEKIENLKRGSVLLFAFRGITSGRKHFFIILNSNPTKDNIIFLSVFTSKVQERKKARSNCPPETLVEVTPQEYNVLSVPSLIDCNSIFEISFTELKGKIKTEMKLSEIKADLPPNIIKKIINGILKSKLIPPEIQKKLHP